MRDLMNVRMTLVPYLYTAFMDYHYKGIPPFRAVVTDYPNDKETFNLDLQYLVGSSLLVAPVIAGQQSREVYLPEGEWFDFWTKKKYSGKQKIKIDVPLESIPVFVKSGAILPLAEPVQYITPETCFDLTVHVFGKGDVPFVLYEDDGETFAYARGQQGVLQLNWKNEKGEFSRTKTWSENTARYKIKSWQHWP
jgi:alpha-D-xyloside xylohydrolase